MSAVQNQGKTAFIKEVLAKNEQANPEAVNRAWTEAGHEGKISSSLVQHVRSELGLTGNIPSRRKAEAGDSATATAPARGQRKSDSPKAKTGSTPARAGGEQGRPRQSRQSEARVEVEDRTRVLTRLEEEIDELLFEVKGAGGLPEFEEALRRARRILARSHQD